MSQNFGGGGLVAKSCLTLATWTVASQAPLSTGLSRQEYWSMLPFPSPGDLPNPGVEPGSPALQADSLLTQVRVKPGGTNGKDPTCQWRRYKRRGFNPWVREIPWRRKWQPAPVFLPGKSHGQRSLAGYRPWSCKESDITEQLSTCTHTRFTFRSSGDWPRLNQVPWALLPRADV